MKLGYTTILHEPRLALKITCNEYCLADTVYNLSTNPLSPVSGWCSASQSMLGFALGVSRQSISKMIKKLIKKDIVIKSESGKLLRCGEVWINTVVSFNFGKCKESLQGVNKVYSKESLQSSVKKVYTNVSTKFTPNCKQSLHNKYIDNNIDNNINKDSVNKLPQQAQPKELKAEKAKTKVSTKNKTLTPPTKLAETLNEQPNNKKVPYFLEFSAIMTHLTKATGKKFRLGKTTSQIKKSDKYLKVVARLKEKYTVTDFLNVIGIKCKEWLEDSKMSRFLRPSTLFAAKNFEKYLDEFENQSKTIISYEYQQPTNNNNRRANRRHGAISQEFSDNIENSLKAFYARTNGDSDGANC